MDKRTARAFAYCRAYVHQWEDGRLILDSGVVTKRDRCTRCNARRIAEWDRVTGETLRGPYIYDYPEGYIRTGQGRRKKSAARKELFDIVFAEQVKRQRALKAVS